SVQIKDVPEQTHAVLRQRAAAAHQSLQEYLRARLIEEASEPTLEEVLDRAGGRAGGSVPLKTAVSTLRAARARRARQRLGRGARRRGPRRLSRPCPPARGAADRPRTSRSRGHLGLAAAGARRRDGCAPGRAGPG